MPGVQEGPEKEGRSRVCIRGVVTQPEFSKMGIIGDSDSSGFFVVVGGKPAPRLNRR